MKKTFLIAIALISVVIADKYAIIFQGDRGYGNYSDSANTCRAYNDILASGIAEDHIIYFLNEAILKDESNPWPDKLFTLSDPEGEGWNHAAICKEHIDYHGKMIEPEIILAVMRQDEEKVKELTGLEHPKVFHTTEKDNLFIYYSDHGYEGGVGCGSGEITTEQMQDALKYLHHNKRYNKLAFFLEACESGSVFDTLPTDLNIYAFTSANQTEPAWCDYCPPNDVVNGKSIGVCMSMFYDNEFQRLWETESTTITLKELFQRTHDEIAKYRDQEVSQWGDLSMGSLPMTDFIGDKPIKDIRVSHNSPNTRISRENAPLHEAIWRAIRSEPGKNDLSELERIIKERSKREIETMRLGSSILGEKEMNKRVSVDTEVYNKKCASKMFEELMSNCGHILPFPESTRYLVHAVCSYEVIPEINWSNICL